MDARLRTRRFSWSLGVELKISLWICGSRGYLRAGFTAFSQKRILSSLVLAVPRFAPMHIGEMAARWSVQAAYYKALASIAKTGNTPGWAPLPGQV